MEPTTSPANTSEALVNCSTQFASEIEACEIYEFDYNRELVQSIVVVVVPLFFGIIGILGLVGNSLVVVVVAANPGMRSTTNILIINLAVADLLFVIFCIPFTAADFVLPYWPFGNVWCKMVQYLIIVTAYASVYTLVLMSLDRLVR
ncbi:allatostatin-a receptor-like protein [Lasius niger]|uniref:Allatostatin-a receptor-like protein n=1 Tax=Lasius niger TaxID=67767 RepID=A0A0J7K110_LASNI|nr:allatostatin-a receptor-like protein [Lasius niger]